MKVKTVVKTRYIGEDDFEFTFEPVEDTISIKKTKDGFEARYLVQDGMPEQPDQFDDNNLFLVNYHRDFYITKDKILKENDLKNWYRGEFDDYKEDPMDENEIGKFPLAEKFHIFKLACYVHSGVYLYLDGDNHAYCQHDSWDTSRIGAVLASKEEWPEEWPAREAARGLVETWNQYLSGDVYGIVKETYDKDKKQIDEDSCWGFYGFEYAKQALETEI